MPTGHFFIAYIIALRGDGTTDYGRPQGGSATWTGLRLRVDNRAFFAQTCVAGQITGMFFTVQHSLASELTLVRLWTNQILKLAALSITNVNPAASLLFTDCIAMEIIFT